MKKRLPHAALLVLSALLAGVVIFLTWPSRVMVFCEQLPELTVLAACAATLLIFSFRALALRSKSAGARRAARADGVRRTGIDDARIAGGAAILAALAFFLSVHFVAQYRRPCVSVQQQFVPARQQKP